MNLNSINYEQKNYISFSEFIIATEGKSLLGPEHLDFLISYLDFNKKGKISIFDFKETLK